MSEFVEAHELIATLSSGEFNLKTKDREGWPSLDELKMLVEE